MKYQRWINLVLIGVFCSTFASANVGDASGFGARTTALGGAGVAGETDAYSAYYNPAALPHGGDQRFSLNWGLTYLHPVFTPISNIVVQNKYVADGISVEPSDVVGKDPYKDTFGQTLGLSYRLFPNFFNVTLGLVAFIPVNQIAYMDTGESYIPEYFLYRARTQRPQFELGVGAELTPWLKLGAGLHMAFSLTGKATVFINTQTNTTSTMRFTSSLQPKFSPYVGALFTLGGESKPLSIGTVLRLPVSSNAAMPLTSSARVFGDFAAVDFSFTGNSVLFYDPMAAELGTSWKVGPVRLLGQVEYQFWSAFQGPAMSMVQPTVTATPAAGSTPPSLTISPGVVPTFNYVNIVVPRAGVEFKVSEIHTARIGYTYRPSILKDLPTGNGNYLDPSKHVASIGWGLNYKHFFGVEAPCQIDFALVFQQMLRQTITKTPGNEAGVAGDRKIGDPGYNAGGQLFGGAVSLALAF